MRKHISYANVAATLALVFSTGGAAVAAQRYLITSASQISPKVLAQLHGRRGARGPKGRRGPRGLAGERGLQGRYGPRGPAGPAGFDGATGATGARGAGSEGGGGQGQSAVVLSSLRQAENSEFKPESERVVAFGEVRLFFFCGFVPLAGNTLGGISVTGPVGGRAEMGLVATKESGAPTEVQMPNLVRSIELGAEPEAELIALVTNNKEPKGNEGYSHATITTPDEVVYLDAFMTVDAATPSRCTLHGSAFAVPA